MRGNLSFKTLANALDDAESLMDTGYTKSGNWTLGQMCRHLRLTIECNMNGYPKWMTILGFPLRPFLRFFLLSRLLNGDSPAGIKTAKVFVPAENLNDKDELMALKDCIAMFMESTEPMHAHPGFGKMTKREFEAFHAAHAAHHFRFLTPRYTAHSD